MQEAVADSRIGLSRPAEASWQRNTAAVCAILLGILFLVSGGWKVLQPFTTGELLEQAKVPAGLGVLGASALGTLELFAAFLLFVPAFRRWGGLLSSALMIFFIGWVGYFYNVLLGQTCKCFPLIERTVGPGFFVSDGIMLLMAFIALIWSPPVRRFRIPVVAFLGLVVLAGVSFGINSFRQQGAEVPNPVIVLGKPQNLN